MGERGLARNLHGSTTCGRGSPAAAEPLPTIHQQADRAVHHLLSRQNRQDILGGRQNRRRGVERPGSVKLHEAYSCKLGGNAVSGGPPPQNVALDCKSNQVTVPACINKTSGADRANCIPTAAVFCLPVRNTSCAYRYSRVGAVCNATTKAKCTGKSCECPVPPRRVLTCSKPPYLARAVWARACFNSTAVNKTCKATCNTNLGSSGAGFTSTCRPDGTWSIPRGSCASNLAPQCAQNQAGTTTCLPGKAACNGCRCGRDTQTGEQACVCNEQQGFTEYSYTFENPTETFSYCVWNLNYPKGYAVRANKSSNVLIEMNAMAGFDEICPGAPVITSVTFGSLKACPPDIPPAQYKTLTPAGTLPLNTAKCTNVPGQGNTLAFAVRVTATGAAVSRGKCADVTVTTTDETTQSMLLRYLN